MLNELRSESSEESMSGSEETSDSEDSDADAASIASKAETSSSNASDSEASSDSETDYPPAPAPEPSGTKASQALIAAAHEAEGIAKRNSPMTEYYTESVTKSFHNFFFTPLPTSLAF